MAFQGIYDFAIRDAIKKRSDAALKRYSSVEDPRAYSLDKNEKSQYILDIVKRVSGDGSNSVGGVSMSQQEMAKQIQELNKELKAKDVELDKMHKLFKQSSQKLDNMNDISKKNRKIESQLRGSKAQILQLRDETSEKEKQIQSMSKMLPSHDDWNETKRRSEMLDNVEQERDNLKSQLCKLVGYSNVLQKLKCRADQADRMEQDLVHLRRELERCGHGASGDNGSKKRLDSACKQCHKYADELERSESILEAEIKKNTGTEAERNFLREKCRTIDVMEAELILYKTNYEEAESRLLELKEKMARSDMNEKQVAELRQKIALLECQLNESERHCEEVINTVEHQEMALKERDVYIDCINRRMQNDASESSSRRAIGGCNTLEDERCVKPGKVQSIVRQLSDTRKSNCKCGIESCCCGDLSKGSSKNCGKQADPILDCIDSSDSVHDPCDERCENLQCSSDSSSSEMTAEAKRLRDEMSCEEIQKLRRENSCLDKELTRYKKEIENMGLLMSDLEKERESNACLEEELKCGHADEIEELQSNFRSTICDKDDELCLLKQELKAELEKTKRMRKELKVAQDELKELQNLKDHCEKLNGKLKCIQRDETSRSSQLNDLQDNCSKFKNENARLTKRVCELEIEVNEHKKYAKSLADQLCNRRKNQIDCGSSPANRPQTCDNGQDREFLKNCLKQLKNNYMTLQKEKMETIQRYEKKLKKAECDRDSSEKPCECNWSLDTDCGDILLRKASKFGLCSLCPDELSDLHNRVRVSMMQAKKLPNVDEVPVDYYTKMADDIRVKYNLSDSLMPAMDLDFVPVKDFDVSSCKTLPSILRCGSRQQSSRGSKNKPRARSSEINEKSSDKPSKCVTISRRIQKK